MSGAPVKQGPSQRLGWLDRLAPLVGRPWDEHGPDDQCWRLVRDALNTLGAQLPEGYGDCAGAGSWVRPLPALRALEFGDVVVFRDGDEDKGDRPHVGLCVGAGVVLHSERPGARQEAIAAVAQRMALRGAIRLKRRPWLEECDR